MHPIRWSLLSGLLLVMTAGAQAPNAVPPGNYKLNLVIQDETPWLIKLEAKDGKLTGKVIATAERTPDATIEDLKLTKSGMSFTLKTPRRGFTFTGNLPAKAEKRILGTFGFGGRAVPAQLIPTQLASLDAIAVNKEILATKNNSEVFRAALTLIDQATAENAKVEEVRAWTSKALKVAAQYGETWQRELAMNFADSLSTEKPFLPVALQYARLAERMLQPTESNTTKRRVLSLLETVLTRSGRKDEAKQVHARVEKIPYIAIDKTAGRKGKGNRAVLIELFTGSECPPCVAADMAFDAIGKTFKPSEVVLLQYHLHIPGADALTNPDNEMRSDYYKRDIEGTPTIFFNGKVLPGGGGGMDNAQEKYDEYMTAVKPLIETTSSVKLQLQAVQKGAKISITGQATDMKPGAMTRVRLVLVEDTVDYKGGNGLEQHHHVVRAMPGGPAGTLLKKTGKISATVDLDKLRKDWLAYLDKVSKMAPFRNPDRPLVLKNLKVVAFVQDDTTQDVLQAVQVDVQAAK